VYGDQHKYGAHGVLISGTGAGKPAGMAPSSNTNRLQLIVTPGFLDQVDAWRRHQPDIPNRSEAIRRMVEIAAKEAKGDE
jgi:hypothetical protein